jgi:hypothetical protein
MKSYLRRLAARSVEDLEQALGPALDSVTAEDAAGFFRHCGYERPSSLRFAVAPQDFECSLRSPPRLARTEQLSRIRSGLPRSMATNVACALRSRPARAQAVSQRRRVEPLTWCASARKLRHGVPSRRNCRMVASTRMVGAGGWLGATRRGSSRHPIKVAIIARSLVSNIISVATKLRDGIEVNKPAVRSIQPKVDVETASKFPARGGAPKMAHLLRSSNG